MLLATLVALLSAPVFAGENWPQFRGEQVSGVVDGTDLPDVWGTEKNVA